MRKAPHYYCAHIAFTVLTAKVGILFLKLWPDGLFFKSPRHCCRNTLPEALQCLLGSVFAVSHFVRAEKAKIASGRKDYE